MSRLPQLIDVHAHLFDEHMPVTAAEAIAAAQAVDVTQFVVPGLDVATSRQAIALAEQFPGVCFATVGVHPWEVLIPEFNLVDSMGELTSILDRHPEPAKDLDGAQDRPDSSTLGSPAVVSSAQNDTINKIVGVGEIGIDYHHHDRDQTGRVQREAFESQLQLGIDHDLPIIVHGRKAYADVLDVIRAHPGSRGLLHSFEADYSVAKQALDLGWIISFTALVTYPGNEYLLDVARKLPLDLITVETDAPYLPPQSVRIRNKKERIRDEAQSPHNSSFIIPNSVLEPVIGKRGINNQPAYIVETAQKLADALGISLEEFAEATTNTARTLFDLPTPSSS